MLTLALCAVALVSIAGVAALVHALRHAPEGHETELGFFEGRPQLQAQDIHHHGGDRAA